MSTKTRGMVGWGLGLKNLGLSWDAISSIPTLFQLGLFQSFATQILLEIPVFLPTNVSPEKYL